MRINRSQGERASAWLFARFLGAVRSYSAELCRIEVLLPQSIHVLRKNCCFSVAECQLTDWTLLLTSGVSFVSSFRPAERPPGEYGYGQCDEKAQQGHHDDDR